MRRGLVVGKFMPLHRGHQLLIETALAASDELTVVVYDSEVPERWANDLMPVEKRARWIADLYPGVHNIVTQADTLEGDHNEHDDPKYAQHYADELAYLGPFTHVFSSEEYGEPFAKALSAEHVMVDQTRTLVPMSGTIFRQNMYEHRAYVDPRVYKTLIQKVVFVGTESTGKSTLARTLAQELNTLHTHEYGRSLWIERNGQGIKPTFHDLLVVGQTQHMQEEAATLHANRYLFCDTNAWTTMLWSQMYYNSVDARLVKLARETMNDYKWFLCSNDFGWVQDGYRELEGAKSENFQRVNENRLKLWDIDYKIVAGTIEERVQQVKDDLGITVMEYV